MRNKAIQNLYPNVSFIIGRDGIFDINHNPVIVNEELIEEEVNKLYAQVPLRLLRIERTQKLQQSDWEVQRNTERNITDSNLIDYRNALRDLPQEIANGNIPAPTLDENGMLVFEHWPNRYEINIEDEPTANNSANTV